MSLNKKEKELFMNLVMELINMPEIKEMDKYIQHGRISTYEHCLSVAYISFGISRKLHLKVNYKNLVRGALLHDFFLYDWHIKDKERKLHGFYHPGFAYKNASRIFDLTEIEKDIILKHMWPLTVVPPRYKEAYVICLADKICTVVETFHVNALKLKMT